MAWRSRSEIMRGLTAAQLLDVWERGLGQMPTERALLLLGSTCPEIPLEDLARLPIGVRDSHLLSLREASFGSRVGGQATCCRCGETLELAFDLGDIRARAADDSIEDFSVSHDGYDISFRLPNSTDLLAAAAEREAGAARLALLKRCVLSTRHDGGNEPVEALPDAVTGAIGARMAEVDPQAEVLLALCCPGCGHRWQAIFDIVSFLWSEVHAWAQRTLHEVHALASAYGWHEADILAMSPARRQRYLTMVSA